MRDIVASRAGSLVPAADFDALADRLTILVDHPECWPDMGRAGRQFVEERHDIVDLDARLAALFENYDMTPWYAACHARVGAPAAPPEADSERVRERRLELLVRVYDVAPSDSEVLCGPASKSVGPAPYPPHAEESETDSGPAA